jgi:ribose transport system substrate-binding protein
MRSGLETFYKNGKIDYVASLGGLTPEDGQKNMEGILQSHPAINIVMGCNDDSIMGSYQAAKSAGVDLSKMGFGGVNAIPQALDLMKKEKAAGKGAYRVTIDIIPFDTGKMCVDLANKILKKQKFETPLVVPAKAVTWANIDSYK